MNTYRGRITYLDGFRLHRALTAGIQRVVNRQNHLNRINVFPVPDGDTGTNLSFTLLSILDNTDQHVEPHAGRTAVAIADAALDGARGNSGIILAQFLQGFSDSCAELRRITVQQFTKAAEAGYEYAHQALSEPVEGTILSVIRAMVDSLKERTKAGVYDFFDLLKETYNRTEEALRRTPEQLEILKKKGVVDAGGQGFVYMLKGMLEFITGGSLRSHWKRAKIAPSPELAEPEQALVHTEIDYRYCTECLVLGEDIPRNKLREAVMGMGNSLVLGGTKQRIRIHIHTDEPQAVFAAAGSFGQVVGEKVDDMQRQVQAAHTARKGVAIVTDSTADVPPELLETYNIHIVPVKVNFGNKGYLDKVTLSPDEFYEELTTNPHHPQTSQPTPGEFWRTYQFLASHHESIVSLHLPPAVSGTLQSAENAARRLPEINITVMNALNVTVGLGLIAVEAAKAASEGKSHEEVVAVAQKAIDQTVIFAAVKDLSYAVRGGRVSRSRKRIADWLRATPVLGMTPKGTVDMAGIFFGRRQLARGLAKWVARRIDREQIYNVFISHSRCFDTAQEMAGLLPTLGYRTHQVQITDTGTAIGAHAGPGSIILALQPAHMA
ncbi:MAG: DegV family EDD domain-containing protein [Fidelibacterota bacterium]|nr:MAG: DegV family EDD domain-containing protein [Candidatus Neomarinimicrobiota bacterium]